MSGFFRRTKCASVDFAKKHLRGITLEAGHDVFEIIFIKHG